MKQRSEVEEKYKWDLTEYFKTDEDWQKEFDDIKPLYKKLAEFDGKLNSDDNLLKCLTLEKKIDERIGRLYVYASLKVKEDGKNNYYKDKANKLEKFLSDVAPIKAGISSELNEFSNERLEELSNNSTFSDFNLMFKEVIRGKKHMLSKQEENLLAMVSECIGGQSDTFDMFDAVDVVFEDVTDKDGNKHPLNNSNYSKFIISDDKELRCSAFKNLNAGYGKINYTLASNYLNSVITDCTIAKIRKFKSAFDFAMFEENVDKNAYVQLLQSVNKYKCVFYKYFKLKQKTLNLNEFNNYDCNVKLKCTNQLNLNYEQAFNLVCDALSVLGEDYISTLRKAKNERWIDVMPNENKDTGAFAWGAYGAHPVVLLNFEGTINSTFTLAHELGHMMHSYYSNKNLPSTKAGYEIFVAEVASTVNEMILVKTLLQNAKTKEEKLYYMDYLMNMFYSTIYRQTMFAEFEYKVHSAYENGEETTTEAINNIYMELCKTYFGKDVSLAEELKYEWSRIPHFYTPFYVYKYATGLISALAITNKILAGEENAVKNYKNFLSSGCTKTPTDLLKIACIDILDDKTFASAFNFAENILNEWEELLNN